MGQRSNPIIIRLGKTVDWNLKYIEKKTTESSLYASKTIEIENFILKFFKNNGLTIHSCKISYIEGSINIFLSYVSTPDVIDLVQNTNKTQKIKLTKIKNKKKYIKKSAKFVSFFYNEKIYNYKKINDIKNINSTSKNYYSNYFKKKAYIEGYKKFKLRRTKNLQLYKQYIVIKKYRNLTNIIHNSFLESFLESLNQYLHKKTKIFLTLTYLNKDLNNKISKKEYKNLKNFLNQLRKFNRNKFFKDGVNTMLTAVSYQKSSDLISNFIAKQLKILKKPNFFLAFIKTTLALIIYSTFSKTKGIKIKIKGRLNGRPRSRYRVIKIGNSMPVLSIDNNINYSEKVSFSKNGTFGIKVWMC